MPIEVSSEIEKQDIANSLVSETGEFQNYLSTTPNYTINNINSLFKDAAYLNKTFDPAFFCKDIVLLDSDQLYSISADDISARFDVLSTMFLSAAIPLTNIRRSYFSFLENKNGVLTARTTIADVALADDAILGNNYSFIFANNSEESSQVLIDNKESFLEYSQISDSINAIRNSLIINEYVADQDSISVISAETVNALSNLFIEGLHNIKNNLSCKFDENYEESAVTLTYYRNSDGIGDSESFTDLYKMQTVTISGYNEIWGDASENFAGWSTLPSQKKAQYVKGKQFVMDKDYSLYPVFYTMYTVSYKCSNNNENASKLVEVGNISAVTYTGVENSKYVISSIGNYGTSKLPLVFVNANIQSAYKNKFLGYATTASGSVAYKAGKTIKLTQNYNLFPKFSQYDKQFPIDKGSSWHMTTTDIGDIHTNLSPNITLNFALSSFEKIGLSLFKKIKIEFTGWVNELNKTHPCTVYATVERNGTPLWSKALFSYSLGNKWSWEKRPTVAYDDLPRTNTGWLNLSGTGNTITVSCEAIDDVDGSKKQGSEGEVFVCRVWLQD